LVSKTILALSRQLSRQLNTLPELRFRFFRAPAAVPGAKMFSATAARPRDTTFCSAKQIERFRYAAHPGARPSEAR
jgi:hypothetical protein